MKVGMIFECGPQGPDIPVCKHLIAMLEQEIKLPTKYQFTKESLEQLRKTDISRKLIAKLQHIEQGNIQNQRDFLNVIEQRIGRITNSKDRDLILQYARLPVIEIVPKTLDVKSTLIKECGKTAKKLLADKCERVVIVWDLYPAWQAKTWQTGRKQKKKKKPCRREDRIAIFKSLMEAGVKSSQVYLACIEAMLEAWLLADERALMQLLSIEIRRNKYPAPESEEKPKVKLDELFEPTKVHFYNRLEHPTQIVKNLPDLKRVWKKCPSFRNFAEKVTGIPEQRIDELLRK